MKINLNPVPFLNHSTDITSFAQIDDSLLLFTNSDLYVLEKWDTTNIFVHPILRLFSFFALILILLHQEILYEISIRTLCMPTDNKNLWIFPVRRQAIQ